MSNISPIIKLNEKDDVVIARIPISKGTCLSNELVVLNNIPEGHKIAIRNIEQGAQIKRYGQTFGFATKPILKGEHVHVHNVGVGNFDKDYAFGKDVHTLPPTDKIDTFLGIRRKNGKIATRNYIGVMSSVNCSATVAKAVEIYYNKVGLVNYPNVDGVIALPQSFGCGIGQDGPSMTNMRRTLSGYATHPNFAGMIIVGLGCESSQIKDMMNFAHLTENENLHTLTIQETGGSKKTIDKIISIIEEMLPIANQVQRKETPVTELILALECGGSDGYSGISANPTLGYVADKIIQQGGTAILSETPEIYGAEHLLTRRAVSQQVGEKLIQRIKWWEEHCKQNKSEINNNPSVGNKAGGLTTILEKSLGAITKGGTSNLVAVYEYAEPVTSKGLVFMDTPGFDPMAVTGQIAGGANILCFTTGRGSALGSSPTPTLKVASNNFLWNRQQEDMDMNCGDIIEGNESIAQAGERLYSMLLEFASGEKSKSEKFGYGSLEFVPWQMGAFM